MKKAIAIIVFGLLFYGSSIKAEMINGIEVFHKDENSIKTSQKGWTFNKQQRAAAWHCAKYQKFAYNTSIYLNKERPKKIIFTCSNPRQQLTHLNGRKIQWTNYIHNCQWTGASCSSRTSSTSSSSSASSSSSSSSSSSTDDKIAQAKQICKDLGFKTNTEKFADCSLKMLSMQFEVQNRETSSDGGTQQKIVVNQGYSVGDAMIALSGIISDANNVRSSYGGGNCRIFQHDYHASLKCN